MLPLLEQIKKTIVFMGKKDQGVKILPFATGFLVRLRDIYHLVTAKHVIIDMKSGSINDEDVFVIFNQKNNGIGCKAIKDIKRDFKVNWIFHHNSIVDIAVIPFGLGEQKRRRVNNT